jgi:two-component system OmpR family sensor kinase
MKRQQRQAELESRLNAERQLNVAREEFVANASHELRTPLTSIIGLSMLLAENEVVKAEAAATELLSIIISESDDLARMVEDLLTTARLDAGALHFVFDDVDVGQEMPETVDPLTRSGPAIGVSVEPGIVRTDRLRFRQLLRNLLSNARKYGGETIRVEGRVEGRTYVCSVIDDGPGVPTEIEDRLFERFIHQGHQTATKDSVGLGLSIVHALTQGMGGSISYQRINGETHFTIRLPIAGTAEDGLHAIEGGRTQQPTVLGSEDPPLATGTG